MDQGSASWLNLLWLNLMAQPPYLMMAMLHQRCDGEQPRVTWLTEIMAMTMVIDPDDGGRDDDGQYGCEVDGDSDGDDIESRM